MIISKSFLTTLDWVSLFELARVVMKIDLNLKPNQTTVIMWRMILILNTSKIWSFCTKSYICYLIHTFLSTKHKMGWEMAQDISCPWYLLKINTITVTAQGLLDFLLCLKNVVNRHIYSPQLCQTWKYCWTPLL
jgi:hypothetical protein